MNKRRSKLDIVNDMLRAIQDKGGKIKPTHLMYKANLSHKLLKEYTDELFAKEMIEKQKEKKMSYFSLTDKGLDFLNQFKKMKEFQDMFGL